MSCWRLARLTVLVTEYGKIRVTNRRNVYHSYSCCNFYIYMITFATCVNYAY